MYYCLSNIVCYDKFLHGTDLFWILWLIHLCLSDALSLLVVLILVFVSFNDSAVGIEAIRKLL